MLVVDPLKRITISEIRQHPWYQVNLPKYLMPQAAPKSIMENLDEEIVQEISTVREKLLCVL
jgi:5'-AMP-activated protein kinase catalytic alpha subunit